MTTCLSEFLGSI